MERAGAAVAELVLRQFPGARRPSSAGAETTAATARSAPASCGGRPRGAVVDGVGDLGEPDVIVDALLGIGLQDAPREDAARMIELINAERPARRRGRRSRRASTPRPARCRAWRCGRPSTVTFGAAKVGLAISPGLFHAGSVASRRSGCGRASTSTRSSPRRRCSRCRASSADSTQVHGRLRAGRRRLARADRRADARGAAPRSGPTQATSPSPRPSRRCRCSRRGCSRS